MSQHSVVEHRANYHYIKLEEDYLAICSCGKCSPHCKALILSVLEHWTNTKRDRCEGDYIYLTMPQWIKYTYMLYERNVITDSLKELLDEGLIERRPIIMFNQSTFEYKLLVPALQRRIQLLPAKDAKESLPRLDAYVAFRDTAKKKAKAKRDEKKREQEQEGVREKSPTSSEKSRTTKNGKKVREKSQGVREKSLPSELGVREKSPTGYVKNPSILDSITKIPSITSPEIVDGDASASPAHHFLPSPNKSEAETQGASYRRSKETRERFSNNSMADSNSAHPATDCDMPSEQQPQGDTLHTHLHQSRVEGTQQAVTPTPGETAQAHLFPSDHIVVEPEKSEKGKGSRKKTSVQIEPSEEDKVYLERERYWQAYINERRGGALRQKGLAINERECIKTLVREYTDEQIKAIDQYVATEVWPHKNNPTRVGGKALLDESRPAWQVLKGRVKSNGNVGANNTSERPSVLISEEKVARNIERAKARIAEKKAAVRQNQQIAL